MPALREMSVLDPMATARTLEEAMMLLLPPVLHVVAWLAPIMVVVWVVVSSLGRTVVLRRVDPRLHARPGTLMVLQTVRVAALLGSFAVWFRGMQWAADLTVAAPIAAGNEPNLVGYFSLVIVGTLGVFSLWAIASWGLSMAPLLAMLRRPGSGRKFRGGLPAGAAEVEADGDQSGDGDCEDHPDRAGDGASRRPPCRLQAVATPDISGVVVGWE